MIESDEVVFPAFHNQFDIPTQFKVQRLQSGFDVKWIFWLVNRISFYVDANGLMNDGALEDRVAKCYRNAIQAGKLDDRVERVEG